MLFNSLLFILVFLPVTLALYVGLVRSHLNAIYSLAFLAVASLVFYGYWDPHFLPIIGISVVGNYLFGLWIGNTAIAERQRKVALIIAVSCNIAALVFYKYINFGIHILNKLLSIQVGDMSVVLPLGISFFTFTQIAYLVDVFSGHTKEKNFIKYLLFVTYFPHLIAGPILHHSEMLPQFNKPTKERFSLENLAVGLTIFAIGLFKKVLIADEFAWIATPVFTAVQNGVVPTIDAWGGALAYTLQIYFDFSGYCDMAMGISLLFGIRLPFNFDAPYKSRSIIEFWQRWHITLSRFLRDYLYITLGGNRCGSARRYANLLITMLLGGLWHGAGLTFIIWGGLHGLYLMINHGWRSMKAKYPPLTEYAASTLHRRGSLILTQLCVVIAWVYFRADNMHAANRLVKSMFTLHRESTMTSLTLVVVVLGYLSCLMLPNVKALFHRREIGLTTYQTSAPQSVMVVSWDMTLSWAAMTSGLLLISVLLILMIGDETPFLYFQF